MIPKYKQVKGPTIPLKDLQESAKLAEKIKDPVYFYNTYIRKTGEKVLTKEEYEKKIQQERNYIEKKDKDIRQYPLTLDESIKPI